MTVIDIVLTVFLILFIFVAFMMFSAFAWSLFEDTNVGSAISEWAISKFKRDDEDE